MQIPQNKGCRDVIASNWGIAFYGLIVTHRVIVGMRAWGLVNKTPSEGEFVWPAGEAGQV
jgi:hypothetical protein